MYGRLWVAKEVNLVAFLAAIRACLSVPFASSISLICCAVIHNMDEVALRGPQGFINARMGAARGSVDTSGHYNPSQNFVLQFNLHQKM